MFQAVLLPITNAQLASSPDSVNLLTVLLVALGLSADCFAVALGVSMSSRRQWNRARSQWYRDMAEARRKYIEQYTPNYDYYYRY